MNKKGNKSNTYNIKYKIREEVIKLDLSQDLECPRCDGRSFVIKRRVTYVYTYKFEANTVDDAEEKAATLPFLFDNREKYNSDEYVICEKCGAEYPIELEGRRSKIDFTVLRKAIRSDSTENAQFLG